MSNGNDHNYKIQKKRGRDDLYHIDDIVIDRSELNNNVEVTWLADDTEFEIWFPKDRHPFPNPGSSSGLPANSRGRRINKKIRNNLDPGTYYYGVFCNKTNTMAEGNSFPKMIIL